MPEPRPDSVSLDLPGAEGSNWARVYPERQGRLDRLRACVESGRPAWWRREGFHKEPYRDVQPKWHVFAGRVRGVTEDTMWRFTWKALCGYSRDVEEIISEPPAMRSGKTPPAKGTRCVRCDAILKQIRRAQR